MLISPTLAPIPLIAPAPAVVEAVAKPHTDNKTGTDDRHHEGQDQQAATKKSPQQLSDEERAETQRLAQRDREVRAHEAAHKGAAGQYARSGAEFEYERGPDGRQYAVGGEVSIDISRPQDPQAAIQKAMIIRRAALAPAQPSAQDRAVAAEAAQMALEAKSDLQKEKLNTDTDGHEATAASHSEDIKQAYNADQPRQVSSINITV